VTIGYSQSKKYIISKKLGLRDALHNCWRGLKTQCCIINNMMNVQMQQTCIIL
jgi:hypothetical protein